MLKIKELRISGVGRFVEDQTILFDSLGNLVQVDGENRNTGGSSGSGKSTLFNALDYLLGINDLPTTVLQSRLTKEPISVRGVFDYDGLPLLITRSKRGLIIDLNNQVTEGSSKLSEEKLDSILGMPRHLFRKLLHKRQKEGGFFLNFTPKQMYEFLTDCLNLSDLRKKTQKVEERLSALEKEKVSFESKVESNRSGLKATQDSILALGLAPVKDIHQSIIVELKQKVDLAQSNFNLIQEKHRNETQELEKERPQVVTQTFDRSAQEQLERECSDLRIKRTRIESEERERQSRVKTLITEKNLENSKLCFQIDTAEKATKQATEKAEEVKKIRAAICPTCEQSWVHASAKVKEDLLLADIAKLKEQIASGAKAKQRLSEVLKETEEIHLSNKSNIDDQVAEIHAEITRRIDLISEEKKKADLFNAEQSAKASMVQKEFSARQSDLRQKQSIELDQVRGQLDVDRRAFESAVFKLKAYEDARIRYENSLSSLKSQETAYQSNLELAVNSLALCVKEIEQAEELKKAIKSFASVSFDDALESVSETATRIIRNIPNMSNATIQFEGTKETQAGKINEEVNAVISMDGEIGIPIKSLSGGERSSVDLAVDLAVIDYLESKTGKGIDIFILDEPFTGLDTVSIEMALEVLKNSNINKKLIVVDHNPEVKQMVTNRLVVVRDGSTSNVVQP